jgi:amidohydrolase
VHPIVEEAKQELTHIIQWRRELHSIPEIGFDLEQTSAYVRNRLEDFGISYTYGVAKTGIIAQIDGAQEGKTIALRADMDALPITEANITEYASTNGNMHACGHDAHTAMLLAAAKLLQARRMQFSGHVKFLFQPAEETMTGGAPVMIEEGCLENPKVDAVLGLHVGNIAEGLEGGKIGVKSNAMMAASDVIELTVRGSGCHGSAPHTGVDTITVAAKVVEALHTMISREISAFDSVVLSFGSISGGRVFNVIPDTVVLKGLVRSFSPKVREYVKQRFEEVVASVTQSMRAGYELVYNQSYPALHNDSEIFSQFLTSVQKVLPAHEIVELHNPIMGAEDMAYYLEQVPGLFFFLGTNNPEKGIVYPNHNPRFEVDEQQLWKGPAAMVQAVLDMLG